MNRARAHAPKGLRNQRVGTHDLAGRSGLARLEPGEVEEVVHQVEQPVGVLADHVQELGALRATPSGPVQELEGPADDRQGGPQLVGHPGKEVVLESVQILEAAVVGFDAEQQLLDAPVDLPVVRNVPGRDQDPSQEDGEARHPELRGNDGAALAAVVAHHGVGLFRGQVLQKGVEGHFGRGLPEKGRAGVPEASCQKRAPAEASKKGSSASGSEGASSGGGVFLAIGRVRPYMILRPPCSSTPDSTQTGKGRPDLCRCTP